MVKWYGRRRFADGTLMRVGALAGLLLLVLCVVEPVRRDAEAAARTTAATAVEILVAAVPDPKDLRPIDLLFPVPAVSPSAMTNSFEDRRGERLHHAVDILAPRNAVVVAVADGTIARLMTSAASGIAVYQWSADQRRVYFYAHLQAYAPDLFEGQPVTRGQVLGYVGTTGNAPPNTPHLHFGISRVEKKDQWWGGQPVNPYPIWRFSESPGQR